jgi:hypothetical protein
MATTDRPIAPPALRSVIRTTVLTTGVGCRGCKALPILADPKLLAHKRGVKLPRMPNAKGEPGLHPTSNVVVIEVNT